MCARQKKSAEATTDPPRPLLPSTDPWQHVFWTGAGAGFANWNAEWEAKLRKEVDAMNAERQATNARFMESTSRASPNRGADDESDPARVLRVVRQTAT